MAKFPKSHWLHNAKAGDLHDALGVKRGAKIPTKALMRAARNEEKGEPEHASTKDAIKASMAC